MHTLAMIAGITLGVASATATIAIAETQQAQIDLRFDLQRSHHVVIQADALPAEGFSSQQLRLVSDLEPVSDAGELSIWDHQASVSRSFPDGETTASVIVADAAGLLASASSARTGAPLDLLETAPGAPIAWLGADLATRLGVAPVTDDSTDHPDAQVLVNGVPLSVAGTVDADDAFAYLADAVIVSRATAVEDLSTVGENIRLVIGVRPGSASAVGDFATRALDLDGSAGLRDITPPDGEVLLSSVAADLRRIGFALAAVIGLVGMLSVANTLVISVYERRREFGLRSAMGWSRRAVASLVLAEATVAGLLAGILGVGIGLAGTAVWARSQGLELILDPGMPLLVVVAGVLASLIGGLSPAIKAASTSPLVAMRS